MRPLVKKLKPSRGFGYVLYLLYNALLPITILVLVRARFEFLALIVIVLSKWRMLAVRPRFWGANFRANAIDMIVGLSALGFMSATLSDWVRLCVAVGWAVWLIFIKPRVDVMWVSLQAYIGLVVGMTAVFVVWERSPLVLLVLASGLLCYFAAHHFFYSFDEQYTQLSACIWGYIGAATVWVLGHWLVFYGFLAQPTLFLGVLSLGLGSMYYLDHFDKLTPGLRRQLVLSMSLFVAAVLFFSDWAPKLH